MDSVDKDVDQYSAALESIDCNIRRLMSISNRVTIKSGSLSGLALEADAIGGTLNSTNAFYSPITEDAKRSVVLEEISTTIIALVAAAIATVAVILRKIYNWIFGDKSDSSNDSSGSGAVAEAKGVIAANDKLEEETKALPTTVSEDIQTFIKKNVEAFVDGTLSNNKEWLLLVANSDTLTSGSIARQFFGENGGSWVVDALAGAQTVIVSHAEAFRRSPNDYREKWDLDKDLASYREKLSRFKDATDQMASLGPVEASSSDHSAAVDALTTNPLVVLNRLMKHIRQTKEYSFDKYVSTCKLIEKTCTSGSKKFDEIGNNLKKSAGKITEASDGTNEPAIKLKEACTEFSKVSTDIGKMAVAYSKSLNNAFTTLGKVSDFCMACYKEAKSNGVKLNTVDASWLDVMTNRSGWAKNAKKEATK